MAKILNKKQKEIYKTVSFKLKEDEYFKLQKESTKENRNITNFIKNCVLEYLKNKEE